MPARWAHPLFATIALTAGLVWAIATEPEGACTTAQPCDAAWWDLAEFGLLLLCLYWIWRQPRLALAGSAVLAAGGLARLAESGSATGTGDYGYLAAVGFVALSLAHRLGVRRRQRALAEEAAGPGRHPLPDAARRFARGRVSFCVAALLLAVSACALWQTLAVVGAYEERAAGADRVSARVVRVDVRDDDLSPLKAVSEDDRTYTVKTDFPEDYPVGSRVDLAVDGDWVRLAAEPYDVFGWQALLLATSVPGLAFLANGLTGRLRSRALDAGGLPVLKVLVREGDGDGRLVVYAADDTATERPLLTFHASDATVDPDDDADDDAQGGLEEFEAAALEDDDDDEEAEGPPLREALLYGAPFPGAEAVVLSPGDVAEHEAEAEVEVERSVTPVRPVARGLFGSVAAVPGSGRERDRRRPVEAIAAEMLPSSAPLSWSADGTSRGVGLFLLLVQGGGVWAVFTDEPSWQWLIAVFVLPFLVNAIATALNWRLTADRDGVWAAGPWRVRRIPWDSVTGVRHTPDSIEIGVSGGKEVELSPVGLLTIQQKLGRRSAALDAAETLRALAHRPELRPERNADPSEQGAPLGPVIVVVAAVWAAVVLLLL